VLFAWLVKTRRIRVSAVNGDFCAMPGNMEGSIVDGKILISVKQFHSRRVGGKNIPQYMINVEILSMVDQPGFHCASPLLGRPLQ